MNLKKRSANGSSQVIPIGPSVHWTFSDDPSVDLAVTPMLPTQDIFDYELIPTTEMATQDLMKAEQIAEGDAVEFSGLFIQYSGQTRIEPIVRTGILAMLPTEPVNTTLGKPGHVYLAEAHVFGGNSGSPMFVNVGGVRGLGISSQNFKLLGVVAGEIFETENLELKITTSYSGNAFANSGISMVVPVDDILAILNSPPFKAQREAVVATQPRP